MRLRLPSVVCCAIVVLLSGVTGISWADDVPRTDVPPVGRISAEQHLNMADSRGFDILGRDVFETDFQFVRRGSIPPGRSIPVQKNDMEVLYVVLSGTASCHSDSQNLDLTDGSVVVIPPNTTCVIANNGDSAVDWLAIGVAVRPGDSVATGRVDSLGVMSDRLDKSLLRSGRAAHKGVGTTRFRRVWSHPDFISRLFAVSHAVVPPGSSIGYHQHSTREEVYYVISGSGRLTANDSTFAVSAGDGVPCRLRGSHGIFNDSKDDVELFVFSVAVEKGNVTGEKNWGDDLSDR